jgi:hypothetical protein
LRSEFGLLLLTTDASRVSLVSTHLGRKLVILSLQGVELGPQTGIPEALSNLDLQARNLIHKLIEPIRHLFLSSLLRRRPRLYASEEGGKETGTLRRCECHKRQNDNCPPRPN